MAILQLSLGGVVFWCVEEERGERPASVWHSADRLPERAISQNVSYQCSKIINSLIYEQILKVKTSTESWKNAWFFHGLTCFIFVLVGVYVAIVWGKYIYFFSTNCSFIYSAMKTLRQNVRPWNCRVRYGNYRNQNSNLWVTVTRRRYRYTFLNYAVNYAVFSEPARSNWMKLSWFHIEI